MRQKSQQQFNSSTATWFIGLSPWILADGNYWNGEYHGFYTGQSSLFALELNPRSIKPSSFQGRRVVHKKDTVYSVTGEVVFTWKHGWVIDFGLYAYVYKRSIPSFLPELQSYITVEAYLGIDHFAYSDFLHSISGFPPLLYRWYVQGIIQEIHPLVYQTGENGRGFFIPHPTQAKYLERQDTRRTKETTEHAMSLFPDAEKTDTHFILRCQLQSLERQHPVKKP